MLLTEQKIGTETGAKFIPSPPTEGIFLSPNQQLLPLTATIDARAHLEIGGCDVTELVKKFGSPLYILDETTLRTSCQQYRDSFVKYYPGESQVIYASKAWSCMAVVNIIASEGIGFDVVSGGELLTTLQALEKSGFPPEQIGDRHRRTFGERIYFHGNNKSVRELELAIESQCKVVVDNWLEMETLAQLSQEKRQQVSILVRLTPGIECHTHEYIRTGSLDSKFGFDANELDAVFSFLREQKFLNCIGLHAHIGSQIFELQPHGDLGEVLAGWFQKARESGLPVAELNVGGGLGIRYTESDDPPSIEEWVRAVATSVSQACRQRQLPLPKLIAEPGRSLIGTACVTAYTVGGKKVIPDLRTYVAVDGGMSDNPRPITYQSLYQIVVANKMRAAAVEKVTVAGKHCESGDILVKDIYLPETQPGDILVVLGTGAYNYSMASNYNRLPRPAAILVARGEANLIIRRETYDDLIRQDILPTRLVRET